MQTSPNELEVVNKKGVNCIKENSINDTVSQYLIVSIKDQNGKN